MPTGTMAQQIALRIWSERRRIRPSPQTPLFHILLRGDREPLADAALWVTEEQKVFLFADPSSTTSPSWQRHEVMVGEVTLSLQPDEVRELYAEILARAAEKAATSRGRSRAVAEET
jgi:hypothetical protein